MSEPVAPPPPPSEPPQPPPAAPPGGRSENRTLMIILSYLGILALVPLLVEKEDKEVQWHAKHGLVLTVLWFVIFVGLLILGALVGIVTQGWGGCLISWIWVVVVMGAFVIHLICIMKGVNGERFLIPGISQYADKF